MEVFIHAHVHLVFVYFTACVLSVYLNLSYCLYACNNFLHVNFMLLINKHTKEDFFYVPSTATYTTHPRHKLAQASKFHLLVYLVIFLNFLKLIHVLIPLPPCWLHLKHFSAYLPFTFNFFFTNVKKLAYIRLLQACCHVLQSSALTMVLV